jgi:hypothetical protein
VKIKGGLIKEAQWEAQIQHKMKFGEYYSLVNEDLDPDIRNYIDQKFDELKALPREKADEEVAGYAVIPGHSTEGGGETLVITDMNKGQVVGRISARGRLISHPVVFGEKVSFAVQKEDGSMMGTIHQLPSGSLLTTFRVSGEMSKGVKFDPIFKRTDDVARQLKTDLYQDDVFISSIKAIALDAADEKMIERGLINLKGDLEQPQPPPVSPAAAALGGTEDQTAAQAALAPAAVAPPRRPVINAPGPTATRPVIG